jgi:hypothetical protein
MNDFWNKKEAEKITLIMITKEVSAIQTFQWIQKKMQKHV